MCHPSSIAFTDDDEVSGPALVNPTDVVALASNLGHLSIDKGNTESPIQPVPRDAPMENIYQLPPELMAEIFTIACHTDSHKFQVEKYRPRMITPFIVGHVCARWRAIVWSTPETWSHVLLSLAVSRYETQISLLEGWLARSGNCPLTIEFNFEDEADWSDRIPIELVQLFASQAPRWTSINWVCPEAWYDILHEIKHNFPLLTTVSTQPLWHDCNLNASKRKRLDLFQFAPALYDIHLNGYYLSDVVIPWEQITRITLQHVYIDECFYGLWKTPNLTFCRIFTILANENARDINERDIKLLSLERLVLFSATWEDTALLLAYMSAPALKTLEFASPQDEDFSILIPFLVQLGCCLTRFKLTDFLFSKEEESELLGFVRDIASLEELDIELRVVSTPVSGFFVELLKAHPPPLDVETPEEKYFLPLLKRFTFSGPVKPKAGFDEALLDALKLRHVLSLFDLKANDAYEHVLTAELKEKFQGLVDDGLRLNITFGGRPLV